MNKVLTDSQIEQFMELGWVKVEEAFPRTLALECQDFLWEQLRRYEVDRNDKVTWKPPLMFMKENFRSLSFDQCHTERLGDAIEDLIGPDRWRQKVAWNGETDRNYPGWGWWPVNFNLGADESWSVPATGWHWDGSHFRHYVDAPDQGLLCLCIFSEIGPHGGGTLIAEGSHQVVARYLAAKPEGMDPHEAIAECNVRHPWLAALTGRADDSFLAGANRVEKFMTNTFTDVHGTKLRVLEATSSPGDVFLCHPFLYHTSSQNHSGVTRFLCNRTTPLKERMNFDRIDGSTYSPLELSIKRALKL
ncbi:hypothetical protein [Paenibacillus lignilyticus]|uniref:Phytanoyl-CoA dioxygenase n=1 Tax=Paenibacillus lignilyticus TaxID=1172615 RepID=A0ABS5CDN0_9BACL|nr:hypothetical protein [Paenibacillus lignilyticus]MBP3963945.1 hypothetical protein [Paenibacillus lignilyticus]